jgi:hypothetical protein
MIGIISNELIIKIFDYLDHEALMKMYEIEEYKDLIKNNVWKNITIKLVKHKRIKKFIDSGWIKCFVRYDLSCSEINNDLLKYFSHCNYINLSYCSIKDEDLKLLENIVELNISYCKNITISAIQYLKKIKILNVEMCFTLNKNDNNTWYIEYIKQYYPHIELQQTIQVCKLELE